MKTWTHWAIIDGGQVLEYDDEETARQHLYCFPDGYVAKCQVTQTPWERVP